MPYLNLDLDYFDHRKTRRLIGLLGRGAEVLPIRLWSYCGKFHCEDGRLSGYSEREIESLAVWWGKAGDMLPAMKMAEWMDSDEKGWFIHDWQEHQGHLTAFKIRGKAAAEARWGRLRADAKCNKHTTSNAQPPNKHCPSNEVGTVGLVGLEVGGGGGRKKPFVVPDFPEMEFYAAKIGLVPTEINNFFDHYESNGWKVGKVPMVSWQATMRKWKVNYEAKTYANRGSINKPNPRNAGIATDTAEQGRKIAAAIAARNQKPVQPPVAAQVALPGLPPPEDSGNGG